MIIPFDLTLTSERFELRMPDETDIDFIWSATRYPGFHDGILWDRPDDKKELVDSLERNIVKWKEGHGYSFTIINGIDNEERVGRISIRKTEIENRWNIGYWVHPEYQGRGIASEVISVITDFGFDVLNADRITADCATWNKASEKALIKNGFKFSRHIPKGFQKKGKWVAENEFVIFSTN